MKSFFLVYHYVLSEMALITISGYPSSGKSRRVTQLQGYLTTQLQCPMYEGPYHTIEVISDDTVDLERSVYDESRSEKPARGTLFTAVLRALTPDKIVILDSLNYIKGFRYQLYCAARESKARVCTASLSIYLSRLVIDLITQSRSTLSRRQIIVASGTKTVKMAAVMLLRH